MPAESAILGQVHGGTDATHPPALDGMSVKPDPVICDPGIL